MRRHALSDMIPADEPPRPRATLLLGLIAAPWLFAVGFDLLTRAVTEPPAYLALPWQTRTGPFEANLDQTDSNGWGDLTRMAGLPRYAKLFENGASRIVRRVTDEVGYLNAPTGQATAPHRDITLIGASFMVAGSSLGQLFSGQLAEASGLTVYNAAWPGVGPSFAAKKLVGQANFGRDRERVVVWGLVQRSLEGVLFRPLDTVLTADGRRVQPSPRPGVWARIRTFLTWTQKLERYLQHTHKMDRLIAWYSDYLPPPALNLGFDSPVRIGFVGAPFNRHMLFLGHTIPAAPSTFASRGGPEICATIDRFRKFCAHRDVRLIVVLVPDKYEIFRPEVEWFNAPAGSTERIVSSRGDVPLTTLFARELTDRGVEALDLYRPLRTAQLEAAGALLLYRAEDTHWSDAGIKVAAQHVAAYLQGSH